MFNYRIWAYRNFKSTLCRYARLGRTAVQGMLPRSTIGLGREGLAVCGYSLAAIPLHMLCAYGT